MAQQLREAIDPLLVTCMDACFESAALWDARQQEEHGLGGCLRDSMDAADICEVVGLMLQRPQPPDLEILHTALERLAALRGVDPCGHEHCGQILESFRRSELACQHALERYARGSGVQRMDF